MKDKEKGKRLKEWEVVVSAKAREKKNKDREEKILFISRTQVTYIELYKLDWVDRV
jgi:hypothetical protein